MRISSADPALPERLWRRGIAPSPIGHYVSLYLQEILAVYPLSLLSCPLLLLWAKTGTVQSSKEGYTFEAG
jgi:hypothetical protein